MDPLTKDHCELTDEEIEEQELADEQEKLEPSARELYDEAVDRGNRDYI